MRQNGLLVVFLRKRLRAFIVNVVQAERIQIVLYWLYAARLLHNAVKYALPSKFGLKRRDFNC